MSTLMYCLDKHCLDLTDIDTVKITPHTLLLLYVYYSFCLSLNMTSTEMARHTMETVMIWHYQFSLLPSLCTAIATFSTILRYGRWDICIPLNHASWMFIHKWLVKQIWALLNDDQMRIVVTQVVWSRQYRDGVGEILWLLIWFIYQVTHRDLRSIDSSL